MENNGLMIVALVAVVTIVSLVMLNANAGSVVYVQGDELGMRFDRALGHNSQDWNAANSQCYQGADGQMHCDSAPIK